MTVDVQYTMSRPVRWDDSAHHGGTLWQTRRETLLIYWFHVYTSTTGVKNEQRCIKKHLFGIYICIYVYLLYILYWFHVYTSTHRRKKRTTVHEKGLFRYAASCAPCWRTLPNRCIDT